MSQDRIIHVIDLGLMEYGEAWKIQLETVEKRIRKEVADTLLIVEHPHVYTLGRKGLEENILNRAVPCYRVERGGDATYHGPGQLVIYPILDLNENGLGVKELVNILEESCIRTLQWYGVDAGTMEGKPGVWVKGKKIASIGLAVRHWVTFHGMAFNINTDLSYFHGIRPCGMDSEIMTSLNEVLGRHIPMYEVKYRLVADLTALLHSAPTWAASIFKGL
jgi:lipoate-protein ligase B